MGRKEDICPALDLGVIGDGAFKPGREVAIEGLGRLLQNEAIAHLWPCRCARLKQSRSVVADPLGGFGNPLGGRLPDVVAPVQHPVDRGHADPGFAGEILDRGAFGHAWFSCDYIKDGLIIDVK